MEYLTDFPLGTMMCLFCVIVFLMALILTKMTIDWVISPIFKFFKKIV